MFIAGIVLCILGVTLAGVNAFLYKDMHDNNEITRRNSPAYRRSRGPDWMYEEFEAAVNRFIRQVFWISTVIFVIGWFLIIF